MSSPQDNRNNPYLKSPYSKPIYPSMDEGFVPLNFSSPKDNGNRQRNTNNFNKKWNNYSKNRGYKHNYYHSGGSFSNDHHGATRKRFSTSGNDDDISNYIHPSMFEDPWKELVEQSDADKSKGECNPDEIDDIKSSTNQEKSEEK